MHTVMSFDSPSLTAMEGDAVREVTQGEGKGRSGISTASGSDSGLMKMPS